MGIPLSKKGRIALGTLLAVVTLTVHLSSSVAELRPSATAAATPEGAAKTTASSSIPSLIIGLPQPKPLLEKIMDGSGVHHEQRSIVASILGLLDDACLEKLQTFAVLYDHPKSRGLAGKGVILVSGTVPDQELAGLLLHEGLGHFRDITCITGTPESGASAFLDGSEPVWNNDPSVGFYGISWTSTKVRKTDAKHEDFVTGYAHDGDSFEDLAESVAYYNTQEQTFRLRARDNPILAQKLAWLDVHMPKTKIIAESDGSWDGKIAWDATKLAFEWSGLQVADMK